MQVGLDSPEAFEEILWHAFWPDKYGNTRINIWNMSDAKEEATTFITDHMKKIIYLRCPDRKDVPDVVQSRGIPGRDPS